MLKIIKLTLFLLVISLTVLYSQDDSNVEYEVITDELFSPWEITEGPDGWLWYTERIGTISRLNTESGEIIQLVKVDSVWNEWERGLLGMAIHPDFDEKPYIYAVYTTRIGEGDEDFENRLIRYEYDKNNDTLINYQRFLTTGGASIHNGSRLKFGPDGYLYMTMGENHIKPYAPDRERLEGKVLRMDENCKPLESNPFYGEGNIATDYIYTTAHRNPQGLVFVGDRLFSSEHGPSNNDEVNEILKGRNYGWPHVQGVCDKDHEKDYCNENNVKEPFMLWSPTVAVSGMDYYSGENYIDWDNSFLVATLKDETVHRLKMNEELTEVIDYDTFFRKEFGRIRDFVVTSDDSIYFVTCDMDWTNDIDTKRKDKLIKIIDKTTNVELEVEQESILVYPNPVKYNVNIKADRTIKNLKLYDPIGKIIYEKEKVNSVNEKLELSTYQSGAYILVIGLGNNRFINKKIIVE